MQRDCDESVQRQGICGRNEAFESAALDGKTVDLKAVFGA